MSRFLLVWLVAFLSIYSNKVYAQEPEPQPSLIQTLPAQPKTNNIFFKLSFDELSPPDSKNLWSPGIPNWNFEIERQLQRNRIISIFSVGYRREEYKLTVGHLINIKAGHVFEIKKPIFLSARVGLEWGSPAVKYRFNERSSGNAAYQVTYIGNHAPDPLNLQTTIILYPVTEISVRRHAGSTLIETGFRANILKLRTEYRAVTDSGDMVTEIRRSYEVAPSIFLSIGFGVR